MGGGIAAPAARVRIKGRKLSVIRFLVLSIAYTTPWIIMLSQLAYYSRIYGPQVLLQLNIAYYLPSIPILLLAGHFEKLLDEQFGTTTSMAVRLTVGLSGCAAIAASYPFIPARLSHLLWIVVVLGSISAVAFSTSYQLVAWFRSADTIALGIGCVASGPLALVIQLALQIGTTPRRWQWIGLFEIAAGLVLIGLFAAWSLFWQYWGILSGTEAYDDGLVPLLSSDEQEQEEHADKEAGEQALMLSRMLTMQDPFQGFPYTTTPGLAYPYLQPVFRRAASDDLSEYRRQTTRVHTSHTLNRHNTFNARNSAQHAAAVDPGHSMLTRQSAGNSGLQQVIVGQQPGSTPPAGSLYHSSALAAAGGNENAQNYHSDAGTAATQAAGTSMLGQPTAAWWATAERPSAAIDRIVGSLASGSVHSSSRAASPSPIPSVKLSSYADELPDFGGRGIGAIYREAPASAPVKKSAYLLGEDDEAELLARLAAKAAVRDLDFLLPGDGDIAETSANSGEPSSPALSQRSTRAATAAINEQAAGAWPPIEHLLNVWAAKQQSGSPSHSPAQTPKSVAAASLQAQAVLGASKKQLQQQYKQQQTAATKPPLSSGSGQDLRQLLQQARLPRTGSTCSACSAFSAASGAGVAESGSAAARSAGMVSVNATGSDGGHSSKEHDEQESAGNVYIEVFGYTWMVVLAALISSTLLNCIFPFFTYVESSGMLGEYLPQVLFYTRMLSDIVGRLVPRKKALAITSPVALLSLSGGLLLASIAFFAYLQVPPRMQHDPYVLVLVLALWLGGGYINTMGYILAPCLVPARLCTKAAAIMVLVYKASHILGLMAAISIALWLYGDISGAL